MNNKLSNALTQAAVLTFSKIGLSGLIRRVVSPSSAAKPTNRFAVNYQGDRHGTVILDISPELLPIITENILGDRETLSKQLQINALGEVAKTLCGNLIPMIYGKSLVIRLDPPEFIAFASDHRSAGETRLEFDKGHADVSLYLNQAVGI